MKKIRLLFASIVLLIVLPWTLSFAQATLTQILDNGSSDNRINVVFLPDGYTESELSKFLNTDVYVMMNSFFNNLPFTEYESYYNVYAISIASNESGSDHPSSGIYRDTYFSSTFETAGIARLLTLSGNGYWRAESLLQEFVPDYDLVVVIVNDPVYGGSGGGIAVTSIHSAAPEVVVHEMGHSFGHLADEYDTYTPGYSGHEGPNTTAETRRDFIKWHDWILETTPIPTPPLSEYSDVVGLFEGACYELYGWYRPKLACKMRSLGPPFCEVCVEQLLKMQYSRLAIIDSSYPASAYISLVNTESATIGIVPLVPVSHALNVRWYVNGLFVPAETTASFSPTGREMGNGSSEVTCKIIDVTDLVRNDPEQYLRDSLEWTVTVSGVVFSPPDLATPDDGLSNISLNPSLSWHPAPGATSYRLQVAANADFSETILFQINIPDTSVIVLLPNPGQYFWRVASEDLEGHSEYSAPRSFFTTISIPSLVMPPDGSTDQLIPLIFQWRKVGGALSYRLQVASDSLFTSIVKDTGNIADTLYQLSGLTHLEKYYWHIRAINPGDTSQYSATWSFITIYPPPPAPLLVSPADGTDELAIPSVFRWHSSTTATSYRICIATDSIFSNIVEDKSDIIDTIAVIGTLDYNTRYFWYVEPSNAAGPGVLSSVWKLTTDIQRPAQASPVNGAVDQPLRVYFIWRSVTNAVTYRLQVATDSSFDDIIFDDSTITISSKWVSGLNVATTYYWRVGMINTLQDTAWSASIYHFRTILDIAITSDITIKNLWNLVSVPLTITDSSVSALFPGASTGAYSYSGVYVEETKLQNGVGYWIKYDSSGIIIHTGFRRLEDTITVVEGWNLIGSLTYPVPVTTIQSGGDSLVLSNFFGYDGSYISADTLFPGRGYWVKVDQEGKLILYSQEPLAKTHPAGIKK